MKFLVFLLFTYELSLNREQKVLVWCASSLIMFFSGVSFSHHFEVVKTNVELQKAQNDKKNLEIEYQKNLREFDNVFLNWYAFLEKRRGRCNSLEERLRLANEKERARIRKKHGITLAPPKPLTNAPFDIMNAINEAQAIANKTLHVDKKKSGGKKKNR